MFYIYAISSISRNYIYIGLTSNIEERIRRHNKGYEKTTKPFVPFKLIYFECKPTRQEAREREKFRKKSYNRKKLKQMAKNKCQLPLKPNC
ncbi:GIY-YIG nuclease family protein [bacterium]|nr:GIY-YIG nuclease family protein [bacterium]